MSYGRCECECSREVEHLKSELRSLQYDLDALKRDLRTEVDDRRDAVHSVREDLSDLYAETAGKS